MLAGEDVVDASRDRLGVAAMLTNDAPRLYQSASIAGKVERPGYNKENTISINGNSFKLVDSDDRGRAETRLDHANSDKPYAILNPL